MRVFSNLAGLPEAARGATVALGNLDGGLDFGAQWAFDETMAQLAAPLPPP